MPVPSFVLRDLAEMYQSPEHIIQECAEQVGEDAMMYEYRFQCRDGFLEYIVAEDEVYDACVFIESIHAISGNTFVPKMTPEKIKDLERFYTRNHLDFFYVIKAFLLKDPNRWVYASRYNTFKNGRFYSKDFQNGGVISEVLAQLNDVLRR